MKDWKTTLVGAVPAFMALVFALSGYLAGKLNAEAAMAIGSAALASLGVGAFAKDAGPPKAPPALP